MCKILALKISYPDISLLEQRKKRWFNLWRVPGSLSSSGGLLGFIFTVNSPHDVRLYSSVQVTLILYWGTRE